jgi:salicylate hydroxylase/6-hydroxynicotinate 3-monooxygenase
MTQPKLSIAIVGAGIAGLTAAAALRRRGIGAEIYEQAPRFARVGAGIQLTPNAMKLLRGFGLEERLRQAGFAPAEGFNREWDTGALTYAHPMGRHTEERYGAPDLMMHRAELHAALAALVPQEIIHFGRKLVALDPGREGVALVFADGSRLRADAVIGADGVHSVVREILLGAEQPRFTGRVAYRTIFPTALLGGAVIDDRVKWWGPDRHLVSYFVNPRRDELYFIASTPEPDFAIESWSALGDLETLREAYSGFHPQVRAILAACPEVRKWALVERDPLPRWCEGPIMLIGDACHPMLPYMAQGAATAMEDAVILSRCLAGTDRDGLPEAFRRCEANRRERTARIQLGARQNTWMRFGANTDWVYDYDAWHEPLAP